MPRQDDSRGLSAELSDFKFDLQTMCGVLLHVHLRDDRGVTFILTFFQLTYSKQLN